MTGFADWYGQVRVPAYAKLNLGLRVLYKRPDGYHELRTVFQTISLADRLDIAFTPARTTRIEIEGTPEIPDNLVERACRLVLEAIIHAHVRFTLKKNIPMGAGLGGGSSDAAAVLLALPVLAGKALPADRLSARTNSAATCRFSSTAEPPSVWAAAKNSIRSPTARRARSAGGAGRPFFHCRGVPGSVRAIDINSVTK